MMPRFVSRRRFVQGVAAASALSVLPAGRLAAQVRFGSDPFQLGVASGDPSPDGFVLWTRLLPEPHEPEQLGAVVFEVDWDVAEDASFTRIVKSGRELAPPHLAHSVHAEVGGLEAGREYFYRFRLGRYESPAGRTLTCPAPGTSPSSLRFVTTSCAQLEQGFFSAYRYMADDRPDLVVELGDYIYEDGYGRRRVRLGHTKEAVTLEDYRRRYAQYKLDPDLQAAHEACPWLVTWDDHEVDNDYAGLTGEHELCGGERVRGTFAARRAAAYQAWYEHMPVRRERLRPEGGVQVYGAVDWGGLARFHVLDTRQYRSVQACARPATPATCDTEAGRKLLFVGAGGGWRVDPNAPGCKAEMDDPSRTVLGAEQEAWLDGSLAASRARWNFLALGTPFAPIYEGSPERLLVFTDGWAGYPAASARLLDSLRRNRPANPVFLTGDVHAFFVSEVRNARAEPVATELVTTSACNNNTDKSGVLHLNPHIRYHDGTHSGYTRCELRDGRLRADLVAIEDMRDPRTPRAVLASFEVRAGDPRARRVDG
jgi:alkaline phosphatase D